MLVAASLSNACIVVDVIAEQSGIIELPQFASSLEFCVQPPIQIRGIHSALSIWCSFRCPEFASIKLCGGKYTCQDCVSEVTQRLRGRGVKEGTSE